MEKEVIIEKMNDLRSRGITFKYLAKEIDTPVTALYEFRKGRRPSKLVHQKLEEYFTKKEG